MLKINDERQSKYIFDTLLDGAVFKKKELNSPDCSRYFMKIKKGDAEKVITSKYDKKGGGAICLNNGSLWWFEYDMEVEEVKAELTIS